MCVCGIENKHRVKVKGREMLMFTEPVCNQTAALSINGKRSVVLCLKLNKWGMNGEGEYIP